MIIVLTLKLNTMVLKIKPMAKTKINMGFYLSSLRLILSNITIPTTLILTAKSSQNNKTR